MPDDHSKSVPPLPIPNRTVKRLRANDSAATSVKVGHRQALILKTPSALTVLGVFALVFIVCLGGWECLLERHASTPVSCLSAVL